MRKEEIREMKKGPKSEHHGLGQKYKPTSVVKALVKARGEKKAVKGTTYKGRPIHELEKESGKYWD